MFYLCFQNILESKEKELAKLMAKVEPLQKSKQALANEIDEAYGTHTNYARRHKLPREVHVKFVRKKTRDEVYSKTREDPLMY